MKKKSFEYDVPNVWQEDNIIIVSCVGIIHYEQKVKTVTINTSSDVNKIVAVNTSTDINKTVTVNLNIASVLRFLFIGIGICSKTAGGSLS
jgi:Zn ribbon nucleic-acid-binding protein